MITVYFRPILCINGADTRLPRKAPKGGMEPIMYESQSIIQGFSGENFNILAHETIFLLGSSSGLISCIDGIAGAEYPRTMPIQKYASDTDTERIVYILQK